MKKTYIIPSVCVHTIKVHQMLALSDGGTYEGGTILGKDNYMDDSYEKPWYRQ